MNSDNFFVDKGTCIIRKRVSNHFIYYLQNYKGQYRWNGLRFNATSFTKKEADGLLERFKKESPQDDYMILGE